MLFYLFNSVLKRILKVNKKKIENNSKKIWRLKKKRFSLQRTSQVLH